MISEEARNRVACGAAHLDRVRPNWFREIDIGILDLSHGCRCIIGQLAGGWTDLADLGFKATTGDEGPGLPTWQAGCLAVDVSYEQLQDAWIEAIADRRLAQPETSAAVDPVPQLVADGLRA